APTDLIATSTSRQVSLSWTSGGGSTAGFNVYRNAALINKVTSPQFLDTNLTPLTTYTYTVCAYDADGTVSPMSSPLAIGTRAPVNITIKPNLAAMETGGDQRFSAALTG